MHSPDVLGRVVLAGATVDNRLPDGTLVEVPWAGHTLGWTRPGSSARALEDVLSAAAADRARGGTDPDG